MAKPQPHWLAGPVAYRKANDGIHPDRYVKVCKWEFVGGTSAGEFRRWHLCFSIETRRWTANVLTVPEWERAHAADLALFFRPQAVLRSMLPKGSIAIAMRSMLPAEQIAEVTAIAMRGGR